jgi:hypothetical protein
VPDLFERRIEQASKLIHGSEKAKYVWRLLFAYTGRAAQPVAVDLHLPRINASQK